MLKSESSTVTISKQEYNLLLDQQTEIELLKQQLAELKRLVFGSKSERFIALSDEQLSLFSCRLKC